MSETPNLNQRRITRQMNDLLKTDCDVMSELWAMWTREAQNNADEFVLVMIGELSTGRALAKLRGQST